VGVFYLILTGKHKWKVFGGIVVAFAILFLLAPYLVRHAEEYNRFTLSDASALHRVESWLVCFRLIRDNFFFGIGFNTLPYVLPRYGYLAGGGSAFGLDGGLLAIFALSGVLGLAGYCYLIGKVLLTSRWIYANSDDRLYRVIAKGASASLLVIVTSSFFTSALLYLFIMEFYWVAFALLNVLYILSKRPATNPARRRPYPSVQKTANFGRRPVPVTSSIR
ncbi:MAG: O-antigen ligase family protein, partial [Acidobacteriia bacterium]|nr:O-antigen ligase family protein [Terriglobia bacterium]